MNDGFREEACGAVNGAGTTEGEHGEELLAETGESVEMGTVDFGICSDLGVVGDVAVGELAAYNVGVFGELRVG